MAMRAEIALRAKITRWDSMRQMVEFRTPQGDVVIVVKGAVQAATVYIDKARMGQERLNTLRLAIQDACTVVALLNNDSIALERKHELIEGLG